MRKSRGPRTLPWGTPHKIVFSLEKIPFTRIKWNINTTKVRIKLNRKTT